MTLSLLRSKKVFLVGDQPGYADMWTKSGFIITDKLGEADIVNFLGGHDVSPILYGEPKMYFTHNSEQRDAQEREIFDACVNLKKFMVGICRGAQFLNVMNGGRMWQDVDNHCRNHIARDINSQKEYYVTSTHHQMMRPSDEAKILMVADESTSKIAAHEQWHSGEPREHLDIEALWYAQTQSLCFQPHPEFPNADDCRRAFMMYVRIYFENAKAV